MFTGIIETVGQIDAIAAFGSNQSYWILSAISGELKVDQSVSHNGVCLTVEEVLENRHKVTAIDETLKKTNLPRLSKGSQINLERCMQMNGRIDGHLVQGHVDCTATCIEVHELAGSWEYTFEFPEVFAALVIEKGSISLNGISLTIFNVSQRQFSVAIIPYTFQNTNIHLVQAGTLVNIEFDMIGKYVNRMQNLLMSQNNLSAV